MKNASSVSLTSLTSSQVVINEFKVHGTVVPSPIGHLLILWRMKQAYEFDLSHYPFYIRGVYVERDPLLKKVADLKNLTVADHSVISPFTKCLKAYFNEGAALNVFPLDPAIGTEFQRLVWSAVRSIPLGQTTSYEQISQLIQKPSASRAVGKAVSENHFLIVNPCHRIVAKSPQQTMLYRGGAERKAWLLNWEKSLVAKV
jgi:O-6-methylguanine DNA methyltransferase